MRFDRDWQATFLPQRIPIARMTFGMLDFAPRQSRRHAPKSGLGLEERLITEVGVLFTRTLRRKLMFGVGLVFGMLLILSVSGILGLNSYRNVIHGVDEAINAAPQRTQLLETIVDLNEVLPDKGGSDADFQRLEQQFYQRLSTVEVAVEDYHRRMEELPSTPLFTNASLFSIEGLLKQLRECQAQLLAKSTRAQTVTQMSYIIDQMLGTVRRMPDPVEGLRRNVEQAKRDYFASLVAVWVSSSVAVVFFLGLLRYGYIWIFHPIRQLHQGALRVAHGDFDYRVPLKTRDEMGELAAAFNEMTARFQEIAADLDSQVQERSKQLVRSERLAGVGFLAAGVAHEINNPLSAIAMAAESMESRIADLLQRLDPAEAEIVRRYLQMIQSESFRCKQITERLLDFSRAREATREPTDLANLISEVVAMVQYLSKYREKKIEFTRTAPCYAEVSSSEIKQVVLNLIANGLDAMERGGTLRIKLDEQVDDVRIEFHDDGCGMTAEVMENMFEPFFTRKQNGQGTGLGLSISHRIVNEHGGTISAVSAGPGQGSTFQVRLPRRAAASKAAA